MKKLHNPKTRVSHDEWIDNGTYMYFLFFRIRITMKTSTLFVICVFMTLAMALSVYGMGGYGYYVPSYGAQQGSNPLGIGQGGLCK